MDALRTPRASGVWWEWPLRLGQQLLPVPRQRVVHHWHLRLQCIRFQSYHPHRHRYGHQGSHGMRSLWCRSLPPQYVALFHLLVVQLVRGRGSRQNVQPAHRCTASSTGGHHRRRGTAGSAPHHHHPLLPRQRIRATTAAEAAAVAASTKWELNSWDRSVQRQQDLWRLRCAIAQSPLRRARGTDQHLR